MRSPQNLLEATEIFNDEAKSHEWFQRLRWPDGIIPCPACAHTEQYFLATQDRRKCKGCGKQFSVKVGTIFEDSPLSIGKWLLAVWLIVNVKKGISSCEVGRRLGITQKSAWFIAHRIRLALANCSIANLGGPF